MARRSDIRGVYAITDSALQPPRALEGRVEQALTGGARMVQYRDKSADFARRLSEARTLGALCRRYGALFIVNDDVSLAVAAGADGVHLGRDDADPAEARRRLGPAAVIGVSCYNDLDRAQRLAGQEVDYLAFGSLFPSATKREAPRVDLETIAAARRRLPETPLVGIGGVNAENAPRAVAAGLDALAVIQAIFAAPDPAAATAAIAAAFEGAGQGRRP